MGRRESESEERESESAMDAGVMRSVKAFVEEVRFSFSGQLGGARDGAQ
jgi:hypothetical protein